MLRLHLSQGSGAAGVSWANAVTSRCDSGAPDSTLRYARFDDRKAAVADSDGRHANVRNVLTSGRMLKPSRPP